jgi:DNA-directed RNA polymerase
VYGVTYIGARTQIQEKIEEKVRIAVRSSNFKKLFSMQIRCHDQLEEKGYDIDEIDRDIFIAAGYLATVTMEVMGDLFQGAKKTKSWLADCARMITQQGHPVAWISPIGIKEEQPTLDDSMLSMTAGVEDLADEHDYCSPRP